MFFTQVDSKLEKWKRQFRMNTRTGKGCITKRASSGDLCDKPEGSRRGREPAQLFDAMGPLAVRARSPTPPNESANDRQRRYTRFRARMKRKRDGSKAMLEGDSMKLAKVDACNAARTANTPLRITTNGSVAEEAGPRIKAESAASVAVTAPSTEAPSGAVARATGGHE